MDIFVILSLTVCNCHCFLLELSLCTKGTVLQRLEASLSGAPEEDQEPGDYGPDPGSQRGAGASDESSLRGLLDLLQSSRRSSGCFGARMDRIGNASGLGCGRGETD
uniref:Uncharacterized protein n=1 Tax=Neogobius melanostomus TaxID=47308 RepID=A0A8C6V3R7_9GOBI